jgi:hypothetical protein
MDKSQKQTQTYPLKFFYVSERGEMNDTQVAAMINTHVEKMTKGNYDWKNPEMHPIRYYEVMEKIFGFMDAMSTEELIGATKVVGCLSDYFWDAHFEKQGRFNQKALVKTFDEIKGNLEETIYHRENPSLKEEVSKDAANNSLATE